MFKTRALAFAVAAALAASPLLLASPLLAQAPQTGGAPNPVRPGTTAPATPAKVQPAAPAAAPAAAPTAKPALIDINSASQAELDALPGIGAVRAAAIIKGRPYKGKDDLLRRKILPSNVYEAIKDRIIAKQA